MSIACPLSGFRLPVEVKIEHPSAPPGCEWPADSPQQRSRWDGFLSALEGRIREEVGKDPPPPEIWGSPQLRIVARITIRPPRRESRGESRGEYSLPEVASRVGALLVGPPPGFVTGVGKIVRIDLSVIEPHPDAPEGFFILDLASPDHIDREWGDPDGEESEEDTGDEEGDEESGEESGEKTNPQEGSS